MCTHFRVDVKAKLSICTQSQKNPGESPGLKLGKSRTGTHETEII